ncbi:MAG: hypothetical protein OCD02_01380 [Spirochaetaceae bacterium]
MSENEAIKEQEIDLLKLVSILLKNIKYVVIITSLFMIGIVIISVMSIKLPPEKSFSPNFFSPTTTVMLNNSSSSGGLDSLLSNSGMGALAGLAGLSGGGSEVTDASLAKKLITTNRFINKISDEFNLAVIYKITDVEYPKTTLKNIILAKLKISEESDTGMLSISYTDIDKYLATKIVNGVTELLEEQFAEIDTIRNEDQFSVITEKISNVKAELYRLQNEIIKFQTKNNIMDVGLVSAALLGQMSDFQSQLLQKEVAIESYGATSAVKDPGYIRLINERDAILNALQKLENGEVGNYPPVKDLPKLALELKKLELEAGVQLAGYTALVQQSETLKITAEGTGSTFQVLELAEVPEMKSGPGRAKSCIIVTFVGFFCSIFFVFLKEVWLNIKNDPEKMKKLRGEV